MIQHFKNKGGCQWMIEHRESSNLRHIGGFIMTYANRAFITLNINLAPDDKARGLEILLRQLATTPIGRSSTYLWPFPEREGTDEELDFWLSRISRSKPYI